MGQHLLVLSLLARKRLLTDASSRCSDLQRWNTLLPSLLRMSKRLEELGITTTKNIPEGQV